MSVWRFPLVFGGALLGLSLFYINRRQFVTNVEETKTRQRKGTEEAAVIRKKVEETIKRGNNP
jgi:hypothetical protein